MRPLKSLPYMSRAINKMAPGSVLSRKSSIISAGWIRSSTTVWRKCSASLPGTIQGWTGRKAIPPLPPPGMTAKFKTPSGKYEFKSELAEKTGHRAAGIQTGSREQTAVPSAYAARAVWSALAVYQPDWMQVFYPEPFVYIHPSSAHKKGISERPGQSQWHR